MAKRETPVARPAVAIVGTSCRFAGAPDPGALWRLMMARDDALSPLESDLLPPDGSGAGLFGRPFPSRMGQLGSLYACQTGELEVPHQFNGGENLDAYFAAQLAFDALADAGLRPHGDAVRGTVRLGYAPPFTTASLAWLDHTLFLDQAMDVIRRFNPSAPVESIEDMRRHLSASLPAPDAEAFFSGAGSRVVSKVARECGFAGAFSAVDAGDLSFFAALQSGFDDLLSGRADVTLVGALTPPLSLPMLEGLVGHCAFSPEPRPIPFSTQCAGSVPGEGGAFFVLKRRADALKARDRIYALAGGDVAFARGNPPLAEVAERQAVDVTGLSMVEACGLGDAEREAAEIAFLQGLWGEHRPGGPLVGLGSVRGNVGHCLWAAGAAGFLKVALSLHARVLAPQVACDAPPESLARVTSSVYLLDSARPWIMGDPLKPRRAAVVGTDVSGTSAAVLLEEEPEDRW